MVKNLFQFLYNDINIDFISEEQKQIYCLPYHWEKTQTNKWLPAQIYHCLINNKIQYLYIPLWFNFNVKPFQSHHDNMSGWMGVCPYLSHTLADTSRLRAQFVYHCHNHCSGLTLQYTAVTWLTHWGQVQMAAISQTIFPKAFSWLKM